MGPTASFLLFIPGMTILAFLTGAVIMTIAMSDNVEPPDDEPADGQTSH